MILSTTMAYMPPSMEVIGMIISTMYNKAIMQILVEETAMILSTTLVVHM